MLVKYSQKTDSFDYSGHVKKINTYTHCYHHSLRFNILTGNLVGLLQVYFHAHLNMTSGNFYLHRCKKLMPLVASEHISAPNYFYIGRSLNTCCAYKAITQISNCGSIVQEFLLRGESKKGSIRDLAYEQSTRTSRSTGLQLSAQSFFTR